MQRSNKTIKVQVRYEDGETVDEKFRDSLGGWSNLLNRINAANGGPNWGAGRLKLDVDEVTRSTTGHGSVMGRRFQIVEVG